MYPATETQGDKKCVVVAEVVVKFQICTTKTLPPARRHRLHSEIMKNIWETEKKHDYLDPKGS